MVRFVWALRRLEITSGPKTAYDGPSGSGPVVRSVWALRCLEITSAQKRLLMALQAAALWPALFRPL